MCLAIPVEIEELLPFNMARVSAGGVKMEISLDLVDGVTVGDFVILHAGFALSRLDPEEARLTLDLFAEMAQRVEAATGTARPPRA